MAEKKTHEYTSQSMESDSVVFALVLEGNESAQLCFERSDGFETMIANATLENPSHEQCMVKSPTLAKGWNSGKLCRFDVPTTSQKGLRVAAYYFFGKREKPVTQPSLPSTDSTPSSSGDKGTMGGEPSEKKGRRGA